MLEEQLLEMQLLVVIEQELLIQEVEVLQDQEQLLIVEVTEVRIEMV